MTKSELNRKSLPALRKLAKGKSVVRAASLKKAELVAALAVKKKFAKKSVATKPKSISRACKATAKKASSPRKTKRTGKSAKKVVLRPVRTSNRTVKPAPPQLKIEPPLASATDKQEIVAHKFDLEPVPTTQTFAPDDENLGELPEAYGTKKLFLTARDPHWLYAYWDMTSQQMADARNASRDHRIVLRVFESSQPFPVHEIHLHHDTRNWYLHIGKSGATWYAQLGFYRHDGIFIILSESGRTTTPRDFLGRRETIRFVTIPADWSLQQLFELVRGHKRAEEKLADVLHRLQMAGFPFPFEVSIVASEWTLEQERALYGLLGGETVRRFRVGSLDFAEWLRRKLLEEISSSSASSLAMSH